MGWKPMTEQAPEIVGMPDRLPMTRALVELLARVTGKPWEIGRIPTTTKPDPERPDRTVTVSIDAPFGILYPQWRTVTGPVRRPNIRWVYQASMAVKRADQLEVFDDKIQGALIGRTADMDWAYPLVVPGLHVMDREISDQNGADPQADLKTELPTRDVRFAVTVHAI
jgi:hypothetical protein